MRGAARLAVTLLAAGLSVGPLAPRGLAGGETKSVTRLGTDGTHFTVNDKPAFLFGVSYYGALGAKDETVRQDLTELKNHGFNWVRVWATWAAFGEDVSAVDGEGKPREEFLKRLERLVAACDEQGVVVDVTLSRGNGSTGPARLQTLEAHRRAVETLVAALKAHRNWYLDLANERNIKDKRFTSFADLKELRFEQLDEEEGRALPLLSKVIAGAAKDAGAKKHGAGEKGGGKPATPAEQYQALRKEYDRASSCGVPLTDAERLKFVGEAYKHHHALALRFLELAEKYPKGPVALDALTQAVWQVSGKKPPG